MQDGFSLLEVVIALALLALVAAGLGQALVQGQQHAYLIQKDREVRAICQTMLMELAGRPWGTSTQVGSIEYMRVNSPLSCQLSQFPQEQCIITVSDVTGAADAPFSEKRSGAGSIYKIELSFRQHAYSAYVQNVQ